MRDDLNLKLLQDRTHVDSNREESPVFVQIEISPDENTKIIEIRPSTQLNNNYKRISQINNLNYRLIKTKELDENQKKFGDIYLPIKELEQCIINFG